MEALSRNISLFVGALLAVLLYIVVGPTLSISGIQPNILFAFSAVLCIVRPNNVSLGCAFILGLLGGFLGTGTLGSMAFVMVFVAFLMTQYFSMVDNDSPFMQIIGIVLSLLVCEFFYAFLLTITGLDISLMSLFIYRVLPCALYDIVVALIMLPLVIRFIGPVASRTQIPAASTFR